MGSVVDTLAEHDGGPPGPRGNSVWSILQRGIDAGPDRVALVTMHQSPNHLEQLVGPGGASPSGETLTWTYAQLRRGAARLGSVLDGHDIPPGSTVLAFLPSSAEWVLTVWTAALKCYTLVTLNSEVVQPARKEELRFHIEKLAPSVVLLEDEAGAKAVDGIKSTNDAPFLGICLGTLTEPRPNWTTMADIAQTPFTDSQSTANPAADHPDRITTIVFTSGTSTGSPKGCLWTAKNLLAGTASSSSRGRTAGPGTPPAVGVIHTANSRALATAMSTTLWHGGGVVVVPGPRFAPETSLRAIEAHRVATVGVLPVHARMMGRREAGHAPGVVASLKRVFLSGEVVTAWMLGETRRVFPGAAVYPSHGMSEGLGLFGWPLGLPDPVPEFGGVVSSGLVMPGTKVRIVGEDGRVVKRSELGDLHVSSDSVIDGYFDGVRPDAFYEDERGRWYRTGDIGVLDGEGRIYILGRSGDVIVRAGNKIVPALVEACIGKHLDIMVCKPLTCAISRPRILTFPRPRS